MISQKRVRKDKFLGQKYATLKNLGGGVIDSGTGKMRVCNVCAGVGARPKSLFAGAKPATVVLGSKEVP
jgi:hypothetical protein